MPCTLSVAGYLSTGGGPGPQARERAGRCNDGEPLVRLLASGSHAWADARG